MNKFTQKGKEIQNYKQWLKEFEKEEKEKHRLRLFANLLIKKEDSFKDKLLRGLK